MNLVLPSTVEEINFKHAISRVSAVPTNMYVKESNEGFENIATERRYKREVSLPNGVENWNISNFDPYLNFEENIQPNHLEVIVESLEDRLVPEGELRQRCESFSSVSSSMDDKCLVYHNLGVKAFNTVCIDSGSTCISSNNPYINSPTMLGSESAETYQNLDTFLEKPSEIHVTDSMSSPIVTPIGSPMTESNLEYSVLSNSFSVNSNCSQDRFSEKSIGAKRSPDYDEDIFLLSTGKRTCDSPNASRYFENRKKNNIASKNCRKTRKEKQKEMETRVTELEKEGEELKVEVKILEEMIQAHKRKLYAILQQKR